MFTFICTHEYSNQTMFAISRGQGIRDFFEVVQTMKDVISLGIGEPDFVTPWHIREAAIYSLEKGVYGLYFEFGVAAFAEGDFGLCAASFWCGLSASDGKSWCQLGFQRRLIWLCGRY